METGKFILTHTFEVDFAVEQALAVIVVMTETVTAVAIGNSPMAVAAVAAAENDYIFLD